MRIKNVSIKNFRNLTDIQVNLKKVTTLIGNNNSGKSNFLRAITLPLLSEDIGSGSKNLKWTDFGNESKNKYYQFIEDNVSGFKNDNVDIEEFKSVIPTISVKLEWEVLDPEKYAMQDFITHSDAEDHFMYAMEYQFKCKDVNLLLRQVSEVIKNKEDTDSINDFKLNLLPIENFSYTIIIPGKEASVSFDKLNKFKYNSIGTERDEFSNNNDRLGSKSLIQLLNNKLDTDSMMKIEKEYQDFFTQIKSLSKMEEVLNWQEFSDIENAEDFFSKISIMPNMPPMASLLNGIKLGYEDVGLSQQGLGYRNMILQLVLINSMFSVSNNLLSLLTIEEPEAHLCYRNEQLLMSYINSLRKEESNFQLVYSTHSTKFIDKLNLGSIVLLDKGISYTFNEIFSETDLEYLTRNPNLDLFKLFYSKKCILVEGISEEILIKSFLQRKANYMNDIEVISFHKGFTKIMDLWLKLNKESSNMLGIVRDFDDEPKAKAKHEEYRIYANIFIETTTGYTLEDEIVNREGNYPILLDYFKSAHNWEGIDSPELLIKKWKEQKAEIMFRFCRDLSISDLENIKLPLHIEKIIKQMGFSMIDSEDSYED